MSEVDFASRTDTVEVKLELLRDAMAAHRYELAQAIANSIKDGIAAERQLHADPGTPVLGSSTTRATAGLPVPWRDRAHGWSTYQVLVVEEPSALERQREPLDLLVSVPASQTARLTREARLARIDRGTGALAEIPSQVYGEVRRGDDRLGHSSFSRRSRRTVGNGDDPGLQPELPAG